jgi:uncharacterized phiE125 gp8 family phage protein
MILTELNSVDTNTLPLSVLSEHLRLGTGFIETSLQDDLLEAYLRAAISSIEVRTGLVIFTKTLSWQLTVWRNAQKQVLPARPVQNIVRIVTYENSGGSVEHAPENYRLIKDNLSPTVAANGSCLPKIPQNGSVDIEFEAGYGSDWNAVPAGMQHAIILLAAHYYENRMGHPEVGGSFPTAVLSLLEGYRPIRLMGGV